MFARKDRVLFLKNDRHLGVKNGSMGTVEKIRDKTMTIVLDDGRSVAFDTREYGNIDHGYAATVHKAQGLTVDRAQVLASKFFDRHVTYVALSRHRKEVQLHFSKDEFSDRSAFVETLSRERRKDLAFDYGRGHDLAPAKSREKSRLRVPEREQPAKEVPAPAREKELGQQRPDRQSRATRGHESIVSGREHVSDEQRFEKMTPAEIVREHFLLELDRDKEPTTPDKEFKKLDRVEKAISAVDHALFLRNETLRVRKEFEKEHPLRASIAKRGLGPDARFYAHEIQMENGVVRAREAFKALTHDPELVKEARSRAATHNREIKETKEKLRELEPHYARAQKTLDLERERYDREHGIDRSRGRGRGFDFDR
jgi:hypothetical protein